MRVILDSSGSRRHMASDELRHLLRDSCIAQMFGWRVWRRWPRAAAAVAFSLSANLRESLIALAVHLRIYADPLNHPARAVRERICIERFVRMKSGLEDCRMKTGEPGDKVLNPQSDFESEFALILYGLVKPRPWLPKEVRRDEMVIDRAQVTGTLSVRAMRLVRKSPTFSRLSICFGAMPHFRDFLLYGGLFPDHLKTLINPATTPA